MLQKLFRYTFVLTMVTMTSQIFSQIKLPTHNPALPFIGAKKNSWTGNPLLQGKYVNIEFPHTIGFKDVMKWKRMKNPYEAFKKTDTTKIKVFEGAEKAITDTADGIFWLGHATFFIRLGGKTFITDPVFGKVSGFMKRESVLPISLDKLPKIDYLLMSHDHRDHCDKMSLKFLSKKNPPMKYFAGLEMDKVLGSFMKGNEGQTAGWYQQYTSENHVFKLWFLPTRHWCKRGLTDENIRLWGSFILEIDGLVIYFGGDSGYGSHYKETAELFPKIDIAILGIGAFEPEWFMESNHSSPAKAFQSFQDLNATYMVPMHYGTFDLADEPVCLPGQLLNDIAIKQKKTQQVLIPLLGQNILEMIKK